MVGPDPVWVQAQAERVIAFYQSYAYRRESNANSRCAEPCWPSGPRCELPRHVDSVPHVAPTVANQPGIKFVGPVPSSRKNHPPYTVTVYDEPTQRATCTCEGYTKYRQGQDCSHIKLIREAIASS